ncbi:MAG: tetratricopeptide repeat protein [Chloroflexi bacterium]|nr:tetratricopeptide repeat protein [Chloroflexota bacterium]
MSAAMSDAFAELLERFRVTVAGRPAEIPLARSALLIAAAEATGLDIDRYEAQLDEWGRELAARVLPAGGPEERLDAVNELLFDELGFRGNEEHYGDPRNLLLHEVIERRTGIPVSLAIVAVDLSQRAGLAMHAVGLPGHVVTRLDSEDSEPLFSDVFRGGARRSVEQLQQIVRSIYGSRTPFRDHFLDPLTPRQVLQRLLHNLKGRALQRGDEAQAERAIELLLTLAPWDLDELRDRGRLQERAGNYSAALPDLEAYVRFRPDAPDAATITEAVRSLRRHLAAETA